MSSTNNPRFRRDSRYSVSDDDDSSQWTPVTFTDLNSQRDDLFEEDSDHSCQITHEMPPVAPCYYPRDVRPLNHLRSAQSSSPVYEARDEEREGSQSSASSVAVPEDFVVEQDSQRNRELRRQFIESMGSDEVDPTTSPDEIDPDNSPDEIDSNTSPSPNPAIQEEAVQIEATPTAQTDTSEVSRDVPQQTAPPTVTTPSRPKAKFIELKLEFGKHSATNKARVNTNGQNNFTTSSTTSVSGVYTSTGTTQPYNIPTTTVTVTQNQSSTFSAPNMKKKKRSNDAVLSSSTRDDVLNISDDDKVENIHYITVPKGNTQIHLVDRKGVLLKRLHVSMGEGASNASKRRKLSDKSQKRPRHRKRGCPRFDEIGDIMSMESMAYLVSNWVLPPVMIVLVLFFVEYISEAIQKNY